MKRSPRVSTTRSAGSRNWLACLCPRVLHHTRPVTAQDLSPPRFLPPRARQLLLHSCHPRRPSTGDSHDPEMHTWTGYPRCDTERARLRGMPEDRFALGAFTVMPDLRPCRLLRFVT